MANLEKYKGVIPAFYACYDAEGNVSPERVRALTEYHIRKGVKGVYVNGSSGECIYQSLEDRKITLENVMAAAKGRLTVIAHVAVSYTHLSAIPTIPPEGCGRTKNCQGSPPSANAITCFCCQMTYTGILCGRAMCISRF